MFAGGSECAGGGGRGQRLRRADGWGGVVAGVQSLCTNTACYHKHNRRMKKRLERGGAIVPERRSGGGGGRDDSGGPFSLLAVM